MEMTLEQQRAIAMANARLRMQKAESSTAIAADIDNDQISQGAKNFAKDMPLGQQILAGAGGAVQNVIDAGKQLVNRGPNAEQVRERKALDAPLMNTGGGLAGNVAANLTMLSPAALLPGGASILGAGAMSGTLGALQPTENVLERVKNIGVGFGLGAGGQFLGTTGATMLGNRAASNQATAAAQQNQNSVRDQTLRDAQAAGYIVPPSAVNPSSANKILESVAGKAAVGQEASMRNQPVTDALARRASGLAPDQPINKANLRAARQTMAQPYREVSALSPQAAADLEALQLARFESKTQWKFYNRSAYPSALQAAQAADANAQRLQQALEAQAHAAGQPQLVDRLRQARTDIARNRQVQNAMNQGTGHVEASVIGRALDNGAPLSGELATIGRFHQAFGPYAREASSIGTPGVSKVGALAAAAMSGGGAAAAGPAGMALGALPFVVPPMARSVVLSQPYQRLMAQPEYSTGLLAALAQHGMLPSPAVGGLLMRGAAPAGYLASQ